MVLALLHENSSGVALTDGGVAHQVPRRLGELAQATGIAPVGA